MGPFLQSDEPALAPTGCKIINSLVNNKFRDGGGGSKSGTGRCNLGYGTFFSIFQSVIEEEEELHHSSRIRLVEINMAIWQRQHHFENCLEMNLLTSGDFECTPDTHSKECTCSYK
jgi:hypothetical protein